MAGPIAGRDGTFALCARRPARDVLDTYRAGLGRSRHTLANGTSHVTDAPHGSIVVGFDDSPSSRTALDWAADEAHRTQRTLVIAHACYLVQQAALTPGTSVTVLHELTGYAQQLVDDAAGAVRSRYPTLDVLPLTRTEQPVRLLLELAEHAYLTVLGRHGGGDFAGDLGSVSQRVAAHAAGSVAVVDAALPRHPDGPVVVGLSSTPGGASALRFAFEQARERHTHLVAVRSWGEAAIAGAGAGLGFAFAISEDWAQDAKAIAEECLHDVQKDFPDVSVQVELSGQQPGTALHQAAESAGLIVVGCRRRDGGRFSRLGGVASWLLRNAACPVAVVGHDDRPGASPAGAVSAPGAA